MSPFTGAGVPSRRFYTEKMLPRVSRTATSRTNTATAGSSAILVRLARKPADPSWVTLLGFLRITSNSAIVRSAVSPEVAWQHVLRWLERNNVWIPSPGERQLEILVRLISDFSVTRCLVLDVHRDALAIEHVLTLYSTDGDFAGSAGRK